MVGRTTYAALISLQEGQDKNRERARKRSHNTASSFIIAARHGLLAQKSTNILIEVYLFSIFLSCNFFYNVQKEKQQVERNVSENVSILCSFYLLNNHFNNFSDRHSKMGQLKDKLLKLYVWYFPLKLLHQIPTHLLYSWEFKEQFRNSVGGRL